MVRPFRPHPPRRASALIRAPASSVFPIRLTVVLPRQRHRPRPRRPLGRDTSSAARVRLIHRVKLGIFDRQ
jgi:hypothetical protein